MGKRTHSVLSEPFLSLSDPDTCGEDLADNLRQIFSLSQRHCGGCADYHVVKAAMRLTGNTVWEQGARPYLLATLKQLLTEIHRRDPSTIDIAIAACADTGILSACAHAVSLSCSELIDKTTFSIFDRCRSPLGLCENFGKRHGLNVRTEAIELATKPTGANAPIQADIVVVHNLLPFVPQGQHAQLLRNLSNWLKPQGNLVLWVPMFSANDLARAKERKQKRKARLNALLESGQISVEEPHKTFLARLDGNIDGDRPAELAYANGDEVARFVMSVGLEIRSIENIEPFLGSAEKVKIVAGLPAARRGAQTAI